jgi:hypothetical protein
MSLPVGFALFVYALSAICSIVVSKRSSNWRIRLLALTVGLLPFCQAVVLLGKHQIWISAQVGEIAEMLELLVGALCLTAIHLLNRENKDRKNTDAKLRVSEAGPQPAAFESSVESLDRPHESGRGKPSATCRTRLSPSNSTLTGVLIGLPGRL